MSYFLAEYEDLVEKWEYLMKNLSEKYVVANYDLEIDWEKPKIISECNRCKNCLVCCFKVLHEFNLYSEAYKNVFNMIKFVLMLSVTQVLCKRTFNILKYIY